MDSPSITDMPEEEWSVVIHSLVAYLMHMGAVEMREELKKVKCSISGDVDVETAIWSIVERWRLVGEDREEQRIINLRMGMIGKALE